MNKGYLSQYFVTVAAKRLSSVEADLSSSHQHEFNGTRELKKVLGNCGNEKKQFETRFVWIGQENEALSSEGFVTWYDARRDHPTRSECRLYFPTTDVSSLAKAGDMLFIARRTDDTVMIIITASGSTVENQLLWLFGISAQTNLSFQSTDIEKSDDREVDFAVRFILEELGIEVEEAEIEKLDKILEPYNSIFPSTKDFSLLARQTAEQISVRDDPDGALMLWMDQEEKLFRRLERQLVEKRLHSGFVDDEGTDIDGFISFSLSVQNRRKSRAGHALENHLEEIFKQFQISYSRTAVTENKSKPDFLFPSALCYHNPEYPEKLLTMLGVKTSAKERWRQVLAEAKRIEDKHLLTLEPGISENQTDEMKAHRLSLVVPAPIHETYRESQQQWLMKVSDFVALAYDRQKLGFETGVLIPPQ